MGDLGNEKHPHHHFCLRIDCSIKLMITIEYNIPVNNMGSYILLLLIGEGEEKYFGSLKGRIGI